MKKEKLTLEVPSATARAYKRASDPEKERVASAVSLALQTPDAAADELETLLDRMSATAKERGMTEEKLRGLLEETDDSEQGGDE